jgi:hypothetical protein
MPRATKLEEDKAVARSISLPRGLLRQLELMSCDSSGRQYAGGLSGAIRALVEPALRRRAAATKRQPKSDT